MCQECFYLFIYLFTKYRSVGVSQPALVTKHLVEGAGGPGRTSASNSPVLLMWLDPVCIPPWAHLRASLQREKPWMKAGSWKGVLYRQRPYPQWLWDNKLWSSWQAIESSYWPPCYRYKLFLESVILICSTY